MLGKAWLRFTALYLRLEKFYIGLASALFFMAWLTVGVVAMRRWHAMSAESHIWVLFLLWMSLALWIALLRGKARRSSVIGCLAGVLWAAAELWFQYLR